MLPVKRAGACTAEVRGSNPLRSTSKSARAPAVSSPQADQARLVAAYRACGRCRQPPSAIHPRGLQWPISVYLIACACITLTAAFAASETARTGLR